MWSNESTDIRCWRSVTAPHVSSGHGHKNHAVRLRKKTADAWFHTECKWKSDPPLNPDPHSSWDFISLWNCVAVDAELHKTHKLLFKLTKLFVVSCTLKVELAKVEPFSPSRKAQWFFITSDGCQNVPVCRGCSISGFHYKRRQHSI